MWNRRLIPSGPRTPRLRLTRRALRRDSTGASEIIGELLSLVAVVMLMTGVGTWVFLVAVGPDPVDPLEFQTARIDNGLGFEDLAIFHIGGDVLIPEFTTLIITVRGVNPGVFTFAIADGGIGGNWEIGQTWYLLSGTTDRDGLTFVMQTGDEYSIVMLDDDGDIIFSGETDPELPDLPPVIRKRWIFPEIPLIDPDAPVPYVAVNISVDVIDLNGDLDVTSIQATLYDRADPATPLGSEGLCSIGEDIFSTSAPPTCAPFFITTTGQYRMVISASDLLGATQERTLDFEVGVRPSSATQTVFPDLTVLQVIVEPAEAIRGDELSIRVLVHNNGSADAIFASVYLNVTTSAAPTSWDNVDTSPPINVAIGATTVVQMWWPADRSGDLLINATAVVDEGPLPPTGTANKTNNHLTVNFTVIPRILLVDDTLSPPGDPEDDIGARLQGALVGAGFAYDYAVGGGAADGPGFDTGSHHMKDYDIVIWSTGYQPALTLTIGDIAEIQRYINAGGSIWLQGSGLFSSGVLTPYWATIGPMLGISTPPLPDVLPQVPGWIVGSLVPGAIVPAIANYTTAQVGTNPLDGDALAIAAGAICTLADSSGKCVGIQNEPNADSRVLSTSVEFSTLANSYDQVDLMYRVVTWLGNIAVKPGRDLAVVQQSISPTTVFFKETITVSYAIRNNGGVNETGVDVHLVIDGVKINETTLDIPAMSNLVGSFPWVADSLGDHVIIVIVDPLDKVIETDEDNNLISRFYSSRDLTILYRIAVVDGDLPAGVNQTRWIGDSLDRLGYDYDYIDALTISDGNLLENYSGVIWVAGNNQLSAAQAGWLDSYLNVFGGRLWVVGDAVLDTGIPVFLTPHVMGVVPNDGLDSPLRGDPAAFIAGAIYPTDPAVYGGAPPDSADAFNITSSGAFSILPGRTGPSVAMAFADPTSGHRLVLTTFDIGFINGSAGPLYSGDQARDELTYLILEFLDKPDSRVDFRITDAHLSVPNPKPELGLSFVLSVNVTNIGDGGSAALVRFLDVNSADPTQRVLIGSESLYLEGDNQVTVEMIWTPLFAGQRTILVQVDPDGEVSEIFEFNNNASNSLEVFFFWDDMANGTADFAHWATLARVNGETPLDFIAEGFTVSTDIISTLNPTLSTGSVPTTTEAHSAPYSYYLAEPTIGDGGGGSAETDEWIYEFFVYDAGPGFIVTGVRDPVIVYSVYSANEITGAYEPYSNLSGVIANVSTSAGQIQYFYTDMGTPVISGTLFRIVSTGPLLVVPTSLKGENVNIPDFNTGLARGSNFTVIGSEDTANGNLVWNVVFNLDEVNATRVDVAWYTLGGWNTCLATGVCTPYTNQTGNFSAGTSEGQYLVFETASQAFGPQIMHIRTDASGAGDREIMAYRLHEDADEMDTGSATNGFTTGKTFYYPLVKKTTDGVDKKAPAIIIYNTGPTPVEVRLSELTNWGVGCAASPAVIGWWNISGYDIATLNWLWYDAETPCAATEHSVYQAHTYKVEILSGDSTGLRVVYGGKHGTNLDIDNFKSDLAYELFGYPKDGGYRFVYPVIGTDDGNGLQDRNFHYNFGKKTDVLWNGTAYETAPDVFTNTSDPLAILSGAADTVTLSYFATSPWTFTYETAGGGILFPGTAGHDLATQTVFLSAGLNAVTFSNVGTGDIGIRNMSFPELGSLIWAFDDLASWGGYDYNACKFDNSLLKRCRWIVDADVPFLTILDGKGDDWIHTILPFEGSISALIGTVPSPNITVAPPPLSPASVGGGADGFGAPPPGEGLAAPAPVSPEAAVNNTNKTMVVGPMDVADAAAARLSFWQKYDIQLGVNGAFLQVGYRLSAAADYSYRYFTPDQAYTSNLLLAYRSNTTDDFGNVVEWVWNGLSGQGGFTWEYISADLLAVVPAGDDGSGHVYRSDIVVVFNYTQFSGGTGGGWWVDDIVVQVSRDEAITPNTNSTDFWEQTSSGGCYVAPCWRLQDPDDSLSLPAGVDNSLQTRAIDLTSAASATLSAKLRFNLNRSGAIPPDTLRVEVSTDHGESWSSISIGIRAAEGVSGTLPDTGIDLGNNWVEIGTLARITVDLTGFSGHQIMIRFRLVTNALVDYDHHDDQPAVFGGVWIDDVIVSGETVQT